MFARAAMVTRTTMIAGGLVCGALADRYGLGVPWLVAAAIFVVALFVGAFTMYDDRPLAMRAGSGRRRPGRVSSRWSARVSVRCAGTG